MGYVYCAVVMGAWSAAAFVYRRVTAARVNRFLMLGAMGLVALALDLIAIAVTGANLSRAHGSQFVLGVCLGLSAVVGILTFLAAIARGELAITWTILTLAFAATSALCIFYPGEPVAAAGLAGLALAGAAVGLLGFDMRRRPQAPGAGRRGRGWEMFMILAFALNVIILYLFRLASHFAPDDSPDHKLAFLAVAHGVTGVVGMTLGLWRRSGSAKTALGAGALLGGMIFLGGLFSMLALSNAGVPGYVFFPMTNGGSAVLVTALSVVFLAERPGRPGWVGIAAGIAALVLLGRAA